MNLALFRVVCLSWLAAVCGVQAVSASAQALHADGAQLQDPSAKTVLLRGVNHHGFVDVPDGAWDPPGKPLYSGIGHWDPEVVKGALAACKLEFSAEHIAYAQFQFIHQVICGKNS